MRGKDYAGIMLPFGEVCWYKVITEPVMNVMEMKRRNTHDST